MGHERPANLLHVRSPPELVINTNANVDVNVRDVDGNTPLHHAAMSGTVPGYSRSSSTTTTRSLDAAKFLVEECGADVLIRNHVRMTPYDVASTQSVRGYLLPRQLRAENDAASGMAASHSHPGVVGTMVVGGGEGGGGVGGE